MDMPGIIRLSTQEARDIKDQPPAAIEAKVEPSLKDKIKARKAKAEAVEAQPVTEQPVDDVQSEELPL